MGFIFVVLKLGNCFQVDLGLGFIQVSSVAMKRVCLQGEEVSDIYVPSTEYGNRHAKNEHGLWTSLTALKV